MADLQEGTCCASENVDPNKVGRLVFACSGGAAVGRIADVAARQLDAANDARMYCLAGLGGRIPEMVRTVHDAEWICVIDGCETACASKTLETVAIGRFHHIKVTDLGFDKESAEFNEAAAAKVAAAARDKTRTNEPGPPPCERDAAASA